MKNLFFVSCTPYPFLKDDKQKTKEIRQSLFKNGFGMG